VCRKHAHLRRVCACACACVAARTHVGVHGGVCVSVRASQALCCRAAACMACAGAASEGQEAARTQRAHAHKRAQQTTRTRTFSMVPSLLHSSVTSASRSPTKV
jgi:hypothetical protein